MIGLIGVRWNYSVDEYRDVRLGIWESVYPMQGEMWSFVDKHLPTTATVAYSNQFMVYPLYGFDERRSVIYAPFGRVLQSAHWFSRGEFRMSIFSRRQSKLRMHRPIRRIWKQNLSAASAGAISRCWPRDQCPGNRLGRRRSGPFRQNL